MGKGAATSRRKKIPENRDFITVNHLVFFNLVEQVVTHQFESEPPQMIRMG